MKIEKDEYINDNGSYTKKTVKTKTSKDGFVPELQMYRKVVTNNYGKFHKGYSKFVNIETNNPKITRPVAFSISVLFIIIGVFLLLLTEIFFGVIFLGVGIFALYKSNKDINRVEEELNKNKEDNEI